MAVAKFQSGLKRSTTEATAAVEVRISKLAVGLLTYTAAFLSLWSAYVVARETSSTCSMSRLRIREYICIH